MDAFGASCGCDLGNGLIYSRCEHTNSPYGRLGTRRLLRYNRFVNSCDLISAAKTPCVQNLQGSTDSPEPTTPSRTVPGFLNWSWFRRKDSRKPSRFSFGEAKEKVVPQSQICRRLPALRQAPSIIHPHQTQPLRGRGIPGLRSVFRFERPPDAFRCALALSDLQKRSGQDAHHVL